MAKKNYNYDDFNKPQKNEKFRPIFMAVLAIFAIGYLIVYRVYISQMSNNPSEPGHESIVSESSLDDSTSYELLSDVQTDSAIEDTVTIENADSNSSTKSANHTDETSNQAADSSDAQTNDISLEEETYTEETISQGKELVMYSEERILYQDGFFYQPITDDVKERIYGLSYKTDCTIPYEDLRYVSVLYYDFENQIQTGEIICNKAIAKDLVEIFYELYCNQYQIDKIRLVDEYNADDDLSCADNNTSCFNYRTVDGSNTLSKHAQGVAIDINPFQNPYVTYPNGKERISPAGSEPYADRSSGLSHMITEDDLCYKLFIEHGFTWGGHWKTLKDYQHFQKAL
ncbi:MAG: M15 family metallopeptidase [Lachnospiraceae bacterium]